MPHYFDEQQEGPFNPFPIVIRLPDMVFELKSASGVFSLKHLDKGTETLLKYAVLPELKGASVLDLGCGYGAVAIVTKRRRPDMRVTASDVNERAIRLTKLNARELHLDIHVTKSNLFEHLELFDCILTNPPYVAGRKTLFALIEQAPSHLNKDGSFQLVARHQKGGKVLEQKMLEVFGNVDVLGKGAGFRVYCSKKE